MNELQKFIVSKGLEKASLEAIKQAICQDSDLPEDTKEFWLGVVKGYSITKDVSDILAFLRRNN